MNIFHRKIKKKASPRKIPPGYLVELRGLEYAEDFNLPEQAARLAKVYEHTLSGGSFEVRKVMSGRTKRSPISFCLVSSLVPTALVMKPPIGRS